MWGAFAVITIMIMFANLDVHASFGGAIVVELEVETEALDDERSDALATSDAQIVAGIDLEIQGFGLWIPFVHGIAPRPSFGDGCAPSDIFMFARRCSWG
jgi:hypothetical protein